MLYVVLFAAMALIRYMARNSEKSRRNWYVVLWVFLFCFSAFRYEVGPDWTGYRNVFEIQRWGSMEDAVEKRSPGFWVLNEVVKLLGLPYPWVNVASSAVFFGGLHYLARRQPDSLGFLVLSFPVLIINMPMSAIRQAMAVGIMCVAFVAFVDKRLLVFVVSVLVAALFHTSAMVFLLLVPLVVGEYTRDRLIFSALLALPGIYALAVSPEGEMMQQRYIGAGNEAEGGVFRLLLLLLTAGFFFVVVQKRWKARFPEDFKLVNLGTLMMFGAFPLLVVSTVIGDRFGYYMIPIQTMMYARFQYVFEGNRNRTLLAVAPYVGLLLFFIVWSERSWIFQGAYFPYRTWLFGFPKSRL